LNILLVKLSSLGDVLHNLPVVWDVRARHPGATVHWALEEGYVQLVEPLLASRGVRGIDRIIPVGLRRWRRMATEGGLAAALGECNALRRALRETRYDLVIETQGLLKSAVVARMAARASGGVIAGLGNRVDHASYEPVARWLYHRPVEVPRQCHVVDRYRRVAAAALGRPPPDRVESPPRFYPQAFVEGLRARRWRAEPYALLFHATARAAKRWPDDRWIAVGRQLAAAGLTVVLPWGNDRERATSTAIATALPGAVVPAAFSLQEAFAIAAGARIVVGVDTGLTHLAAILDTPTVEIYCDSPRANTEGYWSPQVRNLGDLGSPPSTEAVIEAVDALLATTARSGPVPPTPA